MQRSFRYQYLPFALGADLAPPLLEGRAVAQWGQRSPEGGQSPEKNVCNMFK